MDLHSATFNWGDGSTPEAGVVTVVGKTITVSSTGHTYVTAGAPQPVGKGTVFQATITLADDTGGILGFLDGQDKCKPGPVGCVGYCMSGMHITNAAAFYPHRIASAASLYGVGIITDKEDSPHLFLDRIKGELYYAFAETDRAVPPHIPGDLKKLLDQNDIKHELKVFPGTEHGFAFPERAIYNTLAAEETWTKMFAMWDRTLK